MNMYQYKTVDGLGLEYPRSISNIVSKFLKDNEDIYEMIPNGLYGVDLDTGLAKVYEKTVTKTYSLHSGEERSYKTVREATMKFGKLFRRDNGDDVARTMAGKMSALLKEYAGAPLRLAQTPDEIVEVYRNGPSSCMSNSESVRVYGGPDTAVAYVEVDDRILARAVVNTTDKYWACVYGNADLLIPLMQKAGYDAGSLDGCRLLKIDDGYGNWLMPYLDEDEYVDEGKEYFEVTSCGEYYCKSTSGLLEGNQCEACNDRVRGDEQYWSEHHEESYCNDCYNSRHVMIDDEWYATDSDDIVMAHDGEYILHDESCYSEYLDKYIHHDDAVYLERCEDYMLAGHEDVVACPHSNEHFLKDNCTYVEYDQHWIHDEDMVDCWVDGKWDVAHADDVCVADDGFNVHDDFICAYDEQVKLFDCDGDVMYPEPPFTCMSTAVFNFATWRNS